MHRTFKSLLPMLLLTVFLFAATGCGWLFRSADPSFPTPDPQQTAPGDDQENMDPISRELAGMTLEERIGQLFMMGLDGPQATEEDLRKIEEFHVGGFILFGRNMTSPEQIAHLMRELKTTHAGPPLLIGVDEEGGAVSRLPEPLHTLPTARTVAKTVTPEDAERLAEASGRLLKNLGFNVNFAPVLDVDSNPDNPVIGSRAYGTSPEQVIAYGLSVMSGLQQAGIISAAKHFPGHGDTAVDSHIGLPVIDHSPERLEQVEFAPFLAAVKTGNPDMIMAGHLVITAYDLEVPASLSRAMIDGMLREAWGYDGVVITDDLTMGAVAERHEIAEAVVMAVEAGADILLIGHDNELQQQAVAALTEAVKSGRIPERRIDESVVRILRVKHKFGLSNDAPAAGAQDIEKANAQLGEIMSELGL